MMILFWLLLTVFVLVCIIICFLVLIQSDKGGGISGAIGGGLGGANSLLGTQDTANILTRGTVIFTSVFFVLCIVMSYVMSHQDIKTDKSLLQKRAEKQNSYSPASVLNNNGGLPIQQSGAVTPATGAAAQATPVAQPQQAPTAVPANGVLPVMPAQTPEKGKK